MMMSELEASIKHADICKTCLRNLENDSQSTTLLDCKALNGSPDRKKLFSKIFSSISVTLLEEEPNSSQQLCSSCDDLLLSLAIFLEICVQSEIFWKRKTLKKKIDSDIHALSSPPLFDFDFHDESPKQTLLEGQKEDEEQEVTLSTCSMCCEGFTSKYNLSKHMKAFHTATQKLACTKSNKCACRVCEEVFENKTLLKDHQIKLHPKKFVCACGLAFNRRQKLIAHEASKHKGVSTDPFPCLICGKKFKSTFSLKYHQNVHEGLTPYLCTKCPEAFHSPAALRQHSRKKHEVSSVSVAKTPFLCDNCGKSFTRKSHLGRHILQLHSNAPRMFTCHLCGRAFVLEDYLRAHIRNHEAEPSFMCFHCDKKFKKNCARQLHINRVHLSLRPFVCPTCHRAFKVKAHLQKHFLTHTGEKPFSCPSCQYACAEKSNLKKHLKIHDRGR